MKKRLMDLADKILASEELPLPQNIKRLIAGWPLNSSNHTKMMLKMRGIRRKTASDAWVMVKKVKDSNLQEIDIKIAAIQAVLPSGPETIQIMEDELKLCDDVECKNPLFLKCRIHYKLVYTHIRFGNLESARRHASAALVLGEQISGDFSAVQTQVYASLVENNVMRVPFVYKKEDLLHLEKHYKKAIEMISDLPFWMREMVLSTMLEFAQLNMMLAMYCKENKETDKAKMYLETGCQALGNVDESHLHTLDLAYYYLTLAYQHRAEGKRDWARQYKTQAEEYLRRSGRKAEDGFAKYL